MRKLICAALMGLLAAVGCEEIEDPGCPTGCVIDIGRVVSYTHFKDHTQIITASYSVTVVDIVPVKLGAWAELHEYQGDVVLYFPDYGMSYDVMDSVEIEVSP